MRSTDTSVAERAPKWESRVRRHAASASRRGAPRTSSLAVPPRGLPGPTWLRAVQAHPGLAGLRADAHRNVQALVWALAVDARPDGTTMPTWEKLVEQTGLGRRTVARWLAWLQQQQLLLVHETGSTPATRPGWQRVEGNRAAIYILVKPSVDESGTPSLGIHFVNTPFAREATTAQAACGGGASTQEHWPRSRPAATRAERLLAARQLRADLPVLRQLSERAVRAAFGPQLRAGWSVADLAYALDHDPSGTAHWREARVRNAYGWALHRLGLWAGQPARSQLLARQAAARAVEQRQWRERQEAARAVAVPATGSDEYQAARSALARQARWRRSA